jgi:hypothetical protein
MKKKFTLSLVAAAGALSLLAPMTSHAANVKAACVVVTGAHGVNLQIGYAPNGPKDCKKL